MKSEDIFDSRIHFGQGKTATTILTEDGCFYPVIHEPYSHRVGLVPPRAPSAPGRLRRGDRPMHRTTMTIAKAPWEPEYVTTNKHFHSGNSDLEPVRRPPLCPSMHRSQIKLGGQDSGDTYVSDHMATYRPKEIIPANRLHLMSFMNRINQSEGSNIRDVVKIHENPSYWSQYNRVHNKLGTLLGPGVAREYPIRQQYNILTGEEVGPAWKPENARISGNRVLNNMRSQLKDERLLF